MRAVLDSNVIISAVLSPGGSPAQLLRLWLEGAYDLVCSPLLLDELSRAIAYPKLAKYIDADEGGELIELLRRGALLVEDPEAPPTVSSSDPGDDYLIALAQRSRSVLVSGDRELLELSGQFPVYSPSAFLSLIRSQA